MSASGQAREVGLLLGVDELGGPLAAGQDALRPEDHHDDQGDAEDEAPATRRRPRKRSGR